MGVTKYEAVDEGKYRTTCTTPITKRKGDARRRHHVNGLFGSAVAAAIAIADVEADPLGPFSPEGKRKPRASRSQAQQVPARSGERRGIPSPRNCMEEEG